MTLTEIRAAIRAKRTEAKSVLDAVEARGETAEWTDDEDKKFDELKGELGKLVARVERHEALGEVEAAIAAPVAAVAAPAAPSATPPSSPVGVTAVRERWLDDPMRGFKTPTEYLLGVMDVCRGFEVPADTREKLMSLRPKGARPLSLEIRAAVGSDEQMGSDDPHGGFLLPTAMSPDLLTVQAENDPLAGRTRSVPMVAPTVKIPARVDKNHATSVSGGLTVSRSAETVAKTASRMSFEQVVLQATGIFGLAYVTEELLQDSAVTFAALLASSFADEFRGHLFNERLNGTGVGEFEGINSSGCLVVQAKVGSQTATTFNYQNAVEMRTRCWGYSNAIWLANHDVFPQLALMESSGGQIIWQPSIREDRPDLLLGRPIFFTEYCETLGAQGDVVLGNWGEFLEGTYQGLNQAESIHVRFSNHERAFKFWLRNAGGPWWRSAITPKKGASTLSPFVVCAIRA